MKLNNTRKICALTAAVLLIQGTHISAAGNLDIHQHISNLKHGLLMLGGDYYNYVFDYDINSDDKTNVLDLCRMKRSILNNDSQEILDSLAIEKLDVVLGECIKSQNNDRVFTIPVMLENNHKGISALQFDFSYDERYFTLQDVYTVDVSGDVSVSSNKKTVQFIESNGYNVEGDKVVLYAEFCYDARIPDGSYDFGLYNISASNLTKKGQRMLVDEEIEEYSYGYMFHTSEFSVPVTSATTVTTTTSVPQITTTTTLPTTITTTTTPLPTTTTVITTTDPPPQTTVPKYEDGSVYFQVGQPQENHNDNVLKIPVYVQNNTIGVSAANVTLNYRNDLFDIKHVSIGDFPGQVSASQKTGEISYVADSEAKANGIVFYIELAPKAYISPMLLEFSLSSIEAVTLLNDKTAWNIPKDKCPEKSSVAYFWTNGMQSSVVTTTVTPTTTITTPTPVPTTTITTTTTPVPTTTVTTTTTPVPTTTVTTTTTPVPTTTVTTTTTPVPTTTVTTITTPTPTTTEEPPLNLEQVEYDAAELLNNYRTSNGKAELTLSSSLCKMMEIRAQELIKSCTIERPDGSDVSTLYKEHGISVGVHIHLVVYGYSSAREVINFFTSNYSDEILRRTHRKIGIAHYYDPDSTYKHYWAFALTSS